MKIKYIECAGKPREMGRMYGESAKEEIHHNLDFFKISTNVKQNIGDFPASCLPDIYKEIEGIAEGANATLEQIIAMNQWRTELVMPDNCTPMAISAGENVLGGKNNDGHGEDYRYVLRKTIPDNGIPMFQVTYAGWLSGLDALNAEGLANTHGSVGSKFCRSGMSIDIRLVAYHLMRTCSKVDDFINGLNDFSLTGKGFNIIVVDKSGKDAVIEAAVPEIRVRDRNKPFVYSTNHFITEFLKNADTRSKEGKEISRLRLGYLKWIEKTAPPTDIDGLKRILSSHAPWAPCRHGGAHQSVTEWSMIADVINNQLMLTEGSPCNNNYHKFHL